VYDNNYSKMIKKILVLSASLGKIEYKIGDDMIGFYKNQIMFGKIEEDTIYLLNSCDGFDRIDVGLLDKGDAFTKKAQKAYNTIK
jgi:hypothetical protein